MSTSVSSSGRLGCIKRQGALHAIGFLIQDVYGSKNRKCVQVQYVYRGIECMQ